MSFGFHYRERSDFQSYDDDCPDCGATMTVEGTGGELQGICDVCGGEVYRDLVDEADEWRIAAAEDMRYYE